jgi:predicted  nucleic acid-binding Zn-ribbon protein
MKTLFGLLVAAFIGIQVPYSMQQISDLQNENAQYEQAIVDLQSQLDEQTNYQNEIDMLNDKIANLESQVSSKDNTISSLNAEINELEQQVEEQEIAIVESTESIPETTTLAYEEETYEQSTGDHYVSDYNDYYDSWYHNYRDCPFIANKSASAVNNVSNKRPCKCVHQGQFWN